MYPGFQDVVSRLQTMSNLPIPADKTGVALLFGESNILSILPELLRHNIQLVVTADINKFLHQHIKDLIKCLTSPDSVSRDTFLATYKAICPNGIRHKSCFHGCDVNFQLDDFTAHLEREKTNPYHFLSSEARYQECKKAALQLTFANINFDLMSIYDCKRLQSFFKNYNMEFRLCNFTNIHNYDRTSMLPATIRILQTVTNRDCVVMFSSATDGCYALRSNLYVGFQDYLNTGLATSNKQLCEQYPLQLAKHPDYFIKICSDVNELLISSDVEKIICLVKVCENIERGITPDLR